MNYRGAVVLREGDEKPVDAFITFGQGLTTAARAGPR